MFSFLRTLGFNTKVISNYMGEDKSPFRSPRLDLKNLDATFLQMTARYRFLSPASSALLCSVTVEFLYFLL